MNLLHRKSPGIDQSKIVPNGVSINRSDIDTTMCAVSIAAKSYAYVAKRGSHIILLSSSFGSVLDVLGMCFSFAWLARLVGTPRGLVL